MKKVSVEKKSQFFGVSPRVYDHRGIFYEKNGECFFNLPPGEYEIENAEYAGKPIIYCCPSLPWPEKLNFIPAISKIKFILADSVGGKKIGRAAIHTGTNELFINPVMEQFNTPAYYCAVMHEIGHYFYTTEEYCDRFAFHRLIKYGFNPSQFVHFIDLLSEYSHERKIAALKYAENIHASNPRSFRALFGL